jgi:hypothetical protein
MPPKSAKTGVHGLAGPVKPAKKASNITKAKRKGTHTLADLEGKAKPSVSTFEPLTMTPFAKYLF